MKKAILKISLVSSIVIICGTLFGQYTGPWPYEQDFNSWTVSTPGDFCTPDGTVTLEQNWSNETGDDIDWDIYDGHNDWVGTGPVEDHTPGSGGNYLYTESSSCYNSTGYITSPVYDFTSLASPELRFWYFMYGAAMGTLSVQVSVDGGSSWSSDLWSLSGNQQNSPYDDWIEVSISLDAYTSETNFVIRFTGVTGPGNTSDMALDDVYVG
ncbi:MAG: hypothetical protein K8S16_21180, partial [Bacteroidales bacterium]|nr:hypothetical protein [Bacteroidales bacterium]